VPKLKKNVGPLLDRAAESLTLAIELFNRPSEVARCHGVLILLQHSFEMLLKAAILQRTGQIHNRDEKYTYGFDRCLAIAAEDLRMLSKDDRATLSILDSQRDQAAHYYAEVSEDLLYIHAQSAVTLFDRLYKDVFGRSLATRIPNRILPVSPRPPRDLITLFDAELAEVDKLLQKGLRQGARAAAKLRSVLAFVAGTRTSGERVSQQELTNAISRRRRGKDWTVILPEVVQLRLATEGSGIPIALRITKEAPIAVRVAKPGEKIRGTVVKQEVNLWDVFTMSRDDLAEKLDLSGPRTHALIYELKLQSDSGCYRELKKKSLVFKGYSKKALDRLREAKDSVDLVEVWNRHKHRLGAVRRKKAG